MLTLKKAGSLAVGPHAQTYSAAAEPGHVHEPRADSVEMNTGASRQIGALVDASHRRPR